MFLSVFLDLTIFIIILYIYLKKRLHVYESVFMFMAISFTHSTIVQTHYLNNKSLTVPHKPELIAAFWILTIVIVPMIIIWHLELLYRFHSFILKTLLSLICAGILLGIEEISISFKVLDYTKRVSVTAALYWVLLVISSILVQRLFRKLSLKGAII